MSPRDTGLGGRYGEGFSMRLRLRKAGSVLVAFALGSLTLIALPQVVQAAASLAPASAQAVGTAPVVLIVMENHSFAASDGDALRYIVGNPNAPYINDSLIPQGTLFTRYYANHHPSLPDYIDMTAGTNAGCTTDACPTDSIASDNLFHQLGEGGSSFATFAQSMPSACYLADNSPYVVHHNPEAYFTNIDAASGTPYACPSTDLPYPTTLPNPLPDFSFVVPDNCHNMHGSSATGKCPGKSDQIIRDGDAWLSQIVPSFLSLGATVIVTFDEASKDSTNGGGHVVTAMVGSNVVAGMTDAAQYNHFGLLAGLEDYFGLARLANAATATPLPIPTGPPPPAPVITGFDPTSGAAGDTVMVTGLNFTGTTAVRFAGTPGAFTFTDDTSISAQVPAGAVTGPISVTSPGGTATGSTDFTITHATLSGASLASGNGGAGSSFTSSSVTTMSGVLFLWVFDSSSTGTPATVTSVAGLSGTWAPVQQVVSANGHRRLSLWYATGCSGTGRVSVTLSAGAQSAVRYSLEEFRGGIDPTTPIVFSNVKTATATGKATGISVIPNALTSAGNVFYVGLNHSVAENVTPQSGATEITDMNISSSTGVETNDLPGWTTGLMGGTWPTSSRQSVMIGVELNLG